MTTTTLPRSRVKLLLADDDLEILSIMRKRLSTRGYELVEANNGDEALELALSERPHCIVLDVMMPKRNGWEVCKYLRDRDEHRDIGIVMLTAIGPKLNELTSPLYGADEYLDKPFDLDVLEATIEKVLRSRGIELE